MKVECSEHGELEVVHFSGYSLGHDSEVKSSELDLEGITFVLTVPDGDEVTVEDVDTVRNNERYLSKFADVYGDVAKAINGHIERDSFREEASCPHSDGGTFEKYCFPEVVSEDCDKPDEDATRVWCHIDIGEQLICVRVGEDSESEMVTSKGARYIANHEIPDDAVIAEGHSTYRNKDAQDVVLHYADMHDEDIEPEDYHEVQ